MASARSIHIEGIVQGVGFRPFIYGLASRYRLGGWVLNNSSGVEIEICGDDAVIDEFVRSIRSECPPLAVIDMLIETPVDAAPCANQVGGSREFVIRESEDQPHAFVPISPDVATCPDCLHEIFDPANRRYHYPFTNCTNCGPRFTIVRDIPYDRPLTTMAAFKICDACRAEYEDPANRRFHAQPNACPDCGPQVSLSASTSGRLTQTLQGHIVGDEALSTTQTLLDSGYILAIKGLGGYHLACDTGNDEAVQRLRERKGRVDKPFAVMTANIAAVRTFACVSEAEVALLTSRQSPIVLLRKRADCWLSDLVAPGNDRVGVMLPYTPLHHLLLNDTWENGVSSDHPRTYVMTSGNLSEEPIIKDNGTAHAQLDSLVDGFLDHNRDIYIPCDDSVVRAFRDKIIYIRRSRGYAPSPIRMPFPMKPLLAVGGELKNTFCLTNGQYAFMSQHIGDMENLETLNAFEHSADQFQRIFRVEPEAIACDMHPAYLSTRWAEQYATEHDLPLIQVQHHHAHVAAVMAEHGLGLDERIIGLSLDGTGYGTDGTIWGGEILICGYASFARIGRLRPAPLPGGDAAIKRPYRTALAYLRDAGISWHESLAPVQAASQDERRILQRQLETGLNTPMTSSTGRLFDAVAAIAGARQVVTYEAQAAMEFESLASSAGAHAYSLIGAIKSTRSDTDRRSQSLLSHPPGLQFEFDTRPVVQQVVDDVLCGVPQESISARFHETIAEAMLICCRLARNETGLDRVALSGGVFQNSLLLGSILDRLADDGFTVLMHRQLPANDGGLALGQAVIAHAQLQHYTTSCICKQ